MRRRVIQTILPLLLCALPFVAAATIAGAIESGARQFYLENLTWMDVLILCLGAGLFVIQILLALRALQWRGTGFDERADSWLSNMAQAAEWFPLLGLLGTVAAILNTFSDITGKTPDEIIQKYAPAITATGSGLFMAIVNILPPWIVLVGRDLIRTLSGVHDEPAAARTAAAPEARTERARSTRAASSDAGS